MQVLDLFCGLKGWSQAFSDRNHEVFTVDIDKKFTPDLAIDIFDLDASMLPSDIDIVLASPPCESFSVASIGHHWAGGRQAYIPKTSQAQKSMDLVKHTLALIDSISPRYTVVENPRGVLRKLNIFPSAPKTIWYCHYGEKRAKPTDLWGLPFPERLKLNPECHNNRGKHAGTCCCHDHDKSPRGTHEGGTQSVAGYSNRSKIPYELSLQVCIAAEKSLQ